MADLTAQRTLVKSPPELWSELSEVESLARHLGELGEIRIVKVEPESTVAWEGEQVSGTVELEQSGWGTKVTFRATVPEPDPPPVPVPVPDAVATEPETIAPEPEPVVRESEPVVRESEPVVPESEPVVPKPEAVVLESDPVTVEIRAVAETQEEQRQGFFARWLFRRRQPLPAPEPKPVLAAPEPKPVLAAPEPKPVLAAPEPETVAPEPESVEPEATEPEAEAATAPEPEAVAAEPVPAEPDPTPPADPADPAAERVQQVLDGTLEALGQAHHRPFSRG